MRSWVVTLSCALTIMTTPTVVLADAATHQMTIEAADTPSHCPQQSCAPTCMIKASLASNRTASPPLEIAFRYRQPANPDDGAAYFTFRFDALDAGGSTGLITAHVEGLACSDVKVDMVSVTCPESNDRCPGFFYVQIPEVLAPAIAAQKVEGR